ncbi:ATP-dependent helicase HrpB [Paraliomyxa miuraensis]|uniref:ATP-dependent helicase HrpB n=1 Tax=Paraliomyxa miuraensis TaxID=376150 RepID=UPI00225A7B64|nr:ATP-dependent helicase HrpB [Paraliomyxa miuraensis]MCX4241242.1 ATP-dependent helicase HrpB [Paraliomyxa miuraensis]
MPAALPIDALLPEVEARLRRGPNLVLQADPGAGKTTRVPPFLLERFSDDWGLREGMQIVVAQPRRLAVRMAAQRVASELREPVGQRVGYQVRFESKVSDATRIRFVTEGLLVRWLRDEPTLPRVAAVVLDELHERHVDTDLALALLRRLQQSRRPDLRLLAMSATLDPGPVAAFLDAPALCSPGRSFAVEVEHRPGKGDRPLGAQVAEALRYLGQGGGGSAGELDGSVLVFLPGAREIRECAEACTAPARALGLPIVPLHGELPPAEQDRAVAPGRTLILATNVAETSITIEGIAAVIDSGLARRASHDPWSGLPTLTLAKISRASAEQRAGRAGRTRAGRCIRLYPQHELERRPAFDEPELHRLDLAGAMLDLRAHGLRSADELRWLDAPPPAAVDAAESLLRRLGAVTRDGEPTAVGREMLRYPVHPRLARLLVEARRRGIAGLGAGAAAVLGERPLRRGSSEHETASDAAAADVLADLERLERVRRDPGQVSRLGLDRGAVRQVERVRRQLLDRLDHRAPPSRTPEDELCMALLVAFPDRVARVEARRGQPDRLVMAAGGEAELSPSSVVHGATLVVAVAAEQRHDPGRRAPRTVVRSAAMIEPEQLLELDDAPLVEETLVRFDPKLERVEAMRQTRYESLVIDATPRPELPPQATAVLRDAALSRGARAFVGDPAALDAWLARVAFAATHHPELAPQGEDDVARVLASMCEGRRSFAELRRADLLAHLAAALSPEQSAALRRIAPEHVTLPGGRRLVVHYERDRPPWVESWLQDFFGSGTGPAVGQSGTVALVLHLLAPNRRAVQVTTDLEGFWLRHYPELRKALMRRYPKHAWPEDPRTATPPPPRGRR